MLPQNNHYNGGTAASPTTIRSRPRTIMRPSYVARDKNAELARSIDSAKPPSSLAKSASPDSEESFSSKGTNVYRFAGKSGSLDYCNRTAEHVPRSSWRCSTWWRRSIERVTPDGSGSSSLRTKTPNSPLVGFIDKFRPRSQSDCSAKPRVTKPVPVCDCVRDLSSSIVHQLNIVSEEGILDDSESESTTSLLTGSSETFAPVRRRSRSENSYVIVRKVSRPGKPEVIGTLSTDGTEESPLIQILKTFTCYDLMPRRCNVVVIDWQLTINSVLVTMLNNGVLASLVWDSETESAVCMITLTDLLSIMVDKSVDYHQLLDKPLRSYLTADNKNAHSLTVIYAEDSLLSAVKVLCGVRLHRIPVIDSKSGNPLYLLSQMRILKFLHNHLSALPVPTEMYKPLDSLPFGAWRNIQSTTFEQKISVALSQIFSSNVSSLPVVVWNQESQLSVQNILTKVDVVNYLADFGWKNLDEVTVQEVCNSRKESVEGLVTCNRCTPLLFALELLVRNSAHRLVVVDSSGVLCGVISVADLLSAIID